MKIIKLAILLSSFLFSNGALPLYCYYHEATSSSQDYLDCGEPNENVTRIWTTESTIPELTKELFSAFKNVHSIYISGAGVREVHPDTFNSLKPKYMHLNNNKIKNIKPGTLNSLNTTTQLELNLNQLEDLKENTFFGMTSLVQLGLSSNKIKTIEKGAFNGLENLEDLFLGGNEIKTFEVGVFDNLISLELLILYYNALSEIPVVIFSQQRNLRKLVLSNNNLKSLPDRLFRNVTALRSIDFSSNDLQELPENLFFGNENLKELNFESNRIRHLNSKSLLVHSPKIEEVLLINNPWKCEELRKIKKDFEIKNVHVPVSVPFRDGPNVEGVRCTE